TRTPTHTFTPSNTPTATITPSPTLPPEGLRGEQNLLPSALLAANPELYTLGQDGTYWRMGVGSPSTNPVYTLALPADMLDTTFGNNAASRITSVEALIELATWNPPLVLDNAVYFGVMLQAVDDPAQMVGVQLNLISDGVFNIAQRVGDDVTLIAQRSLNGNQARIRLTRDNNLVALYVNNEQIGAALELDQPEVLPAIYVKEGGVIIHIRAWEVILR
ncbi:MAG: hypothetical protein IAE80_07910, partial [Anaerolinea sp.]|nr:hypothetical protein [Anaerolinea sp.]